MRRHRMHGDEEARRPKTRECPVIANASAALLLYCSREMAVRRGDLVGDRDTSGWSIGALAPRGAGRKRTGAHDQTRSHQDTCSGLPTLRAA